jgi:hypothetical protein
MSLAKNEESRILRRVPARSRMTGGSPTLVAQRSGAPESPSHFK